MSRECLKMSFLKSSGSFTVVGAALLAVASLGCGKATPERIATHPAKGTITFKGQPMPGAFVTLHPKSPVENVPAPRANVDKDGTFAVTTYNNGDGAPEGDYVLTVQWYKLIKNGKDVSAGPNVIPPKYTKPQTSDVVIHIAAGENELKPIKL
jgi:hypothetical protein